MRNGFKISTTIVVVSHIALSADFRLLGEVHGFFLKFFWPPPWGGQLEKFGLFMRRVASFPPLVNWQASASSKAQILGSREGSVAVFLSTHDLLQQVFSKGFILPAGFSFIPAYVVIHSHGPTYTLFLSLLAKVFDKDGMYPLQTNSRVWSISYACIWRASSLRIRFS